MCILELNYDSTVILTGTCGLNNRPVLEARPFHSAEEEARAKAIRAKRAEQNPTN